MDFEQNGTPGGPLHRFLPLLVLCLVSTIPFVHAADRWDHLIDDAYITLTFAKNLARGDGFVFNQPPAVLGTTSPLLALSVALFAKLFPAIELGKIAAHGTALMLVASAWLFYFSRDRLRLTHWQAALVGVLLLCYFNPNLLGMETNLFLFLLIASFVCATNGWAFTCGLVIGLLSLTRGEGVLMGACVGAYFILGRRHAASEQGRAVVYMLARLAAGFALVLIPWIVYAEFTFGHLLPETLGAKRALAGYFKGRNSQGVFGSAWGPGFLLYTGMAETIPVLPRVCVWIYYVIGLFVIARNRHGWRLLYVYIFCYIAGYTFLGPMYFDWYGAPIFSVWIITAALGMGAPLEQGFASRRRPRNWMTALRVLLPIILCGCLVYASFRGMIESFNDFYYYPKTRTYLELAKWFNENAQPSDRVAYGEIGYLGYFTDNAVYDLSGLVSPEVIPYLRRRDPVTPFFEALPEYMVWTQRDSTWARIVFHREFPSHYKLAATLPFLASAPRQRQILIFKRRAAPHWPFENDEAWGVWLGTIDAGSPFADDS